MSFVEAGGYFAQLREQRNNEVAKCHRDRMEALKLPVPNCLSPEELTRLYNMNIERAYDYGIESITGQPNKQAQSSGAAKKLSWSHLQALKETW